jgi:hypothetical protein
MVPGRLLASFSDSPKAQFNGLKVEAPRKVMRPEKG